MGSKVRYYSGNCGLSMNAETLDRSNESRSEDEYMPKSREGLDEASGG